MMAKKSALPNLDNATPGFLVDEIKNVRDKIKDLQKLEKWYVQGLYARVKPKQQVIEGEKLVWLGVIESVSQLRLDSEKIREDMSEEWIAKYSKKIEFKQLRITKREEQL